MSRECFSIMSVIYILLMAALDLAGIFCNIRMLWSCFKDKTKYRLLQSCRTLSIFQCACQVTILGGNALQTWKLWLDIPPKETCDIFRALTISVMFFQACNFVILINQSHHPLEFENGRVPLKPKVLAALLLALNGSAMIWYSCLSQEILSHYAILFVVMTVTAFVVLLFATDSRNNIPDEGEDTTVKTLMKTGAILWKKFEENKRLMLFSALLLICVGVFLWVSPRLAFSIDSEQTKFFEEVVYLLTAFLFGVVLPLSISYLIDDSYVKVNESTILVV